MSPVRRGTPEAALKTIRPELAGAQALEHTVDIAETVIGGPPTTGAATTDDGDAAATSGSPDADESKTEGVGGPPQTPLS